MNDYLNLPPHQRELLAGKQDESPKKATVKETNQPSLPLGRDTSTYVKPVAHCDSCGWVSGDLSHRQISELRAFGCRECKKEIRIVDLWE